MINFFKDLFKGINSSDGLESIMSLIILCMLISTVALVISVIKGIYNIIEFFIT